METRLLMEPTSQREAWTRRCCNRLRFQILIPRRLFRPPEPLVVRPGLSRNSCGALSAGREQ